MTALSIAVFFGYIRRWGAKVRDRALFSAARSAVRHGTTDSAAKVGRFGPVKQKKMGSLGRLTLCHPTKSAKVGKPWFSTVLIEVVAG
jgi:hypothetical protein